MGSLYLVRHGQASFGADNYDLLSPLGRQQSVRLGEYFKYKGVHFDAVLTGTLSRQIQTLEGLCEGMGVRFENPAVEGPTQAILVPSDRSEVREVFSESGVTNCLGARAASAGSFPHPPAGAAEPALPGRRRSAPSGGSAVREATSVGAKAASAGPPQARPAPLGGSAVREATSVGARAASAGPPQARPAPLGGSALHEVKSVGAHLLWPGLNEYDSAAVIGAIHPYPLEKPDTPELYKHHFRLLKDGLAQWMAGVVSPRGMPDYNDFVAGVTSALAHVRSHYRGNVLLVSSGGPIATAVGQVLGTSPETTIELNMQIRNSSVTEFAFSAKRHRLVSFNTLAHLDAPEHAGWVTYA